MKNLVIVIMLLCCIFSTGCATTAIADNGIASTAANASAAVEQYKIATPPSYVLSFSVNDKGHLIWSDSDGVKVNMTAAMYLMGRLSGIVQKNVGAEK
jgi:predicted small secreted protein